MMSRRSLDEESDGMNDGMNEGTRPWLSGYDCNRIAPDQNHFDSTLDNLDAIYMVSGDLKCWHLERPEVAQINPSQLIDDPDDTEGLKKVAAIRTAIAAGQSMPPTIVIHRPDDPVHPYELIEGRHRYNAAYTDQAPLLAWVAHIACCGGPPADLM